MLARLQVIFFNLPIASITKNNINLSKICGDLMHSLANPVDQKWENVKLKTNMKYFSCKYLIWQQDRLKNRIRLLYAFNLCLSPMLITLCSLN